MFISLIFTVIKYDWPGTGRTQFRCKYQNRAQNANYLHVSTGRKHSENSENGFSDHYAVIYGSGQHMVKFNKYNFIKITY